MWVGNINLNIILTALRWFGYCSYLWHLWKETVLYFFFLMWYEHSVSVLKYLYGFLLPIRQRLKIFNFRFFVVCLLPTSLAQIHTTPFHRQWLFPISILPFSIRNRTLRSSWYHQFSNYSNWICILINTDTMFLRQTRKCT